MIDISFEVFVLIVSLIWIICAVKSAKESHGWGD